MMVSVIMSLNQQNRANVFIVKKIKEKKDKIFQKLFKKIQKQILKTNSQQYKDNSS